MLNHVPEKITVVASDGPIHKHENWFIYAVEPVRIPDMSEVVTHVADAAIFLQGEHIRITRDGRPGTARPYDMKTQTFLKR